MAAERSRLISELFDRIRTATLPACVPRNYEGLPDTLEGDLDLLVEPARRAELARWIVELGESRGWRVFFERTDWNHLHLVLWHPDTVGGEDTIHFDLQDALGRKGFRYAPVRPFLEGTEWLEGVPVASAPARTTALALHVLLDKGHVRARYRRALERDFDERVAPLARRVLDERTSTAVVDWVRGGAPDDRVAELAQRVRRHLKRRYPLNRLRPVAFRTHRRLRLFGPRRGVLVGAVGPNGSGKTSSLEAVLARLPPGPFPACVAYMGKRDVFLPTTRLIRRLHERRGGRQGAAAAAERAAEPPTAAGRLKDLAGLANWVVEQWVRYWVHVRPALQQDGVVLVDRYSYDVSGRPPWSFVHGPRAGRLFRALFPTPDRTYLFWERPDVLWQRKREDTPAEAERCLRELRGILRHVPNVTEIRTNVPTEAIARGIVADVVDAAERGRSR